jgi:hypothetical protein
MKKQILWQVITAACLAAQSQIPRTWEDAAIASVTLPLAVADASPVHVPSKYYYGIPVRPIYKSYPVYHPDKEPPGYIDRLMQQEPVIGFDPSTLKSPRDWIKAGELVFDAALSYGSIAGPRSDLYLRDPAWHQYVGTPVAKDGIIPFYRYVITKKGTIEIGVFSCAMCHTRVMPDGSIVRGAQGNFPFDRALARDTSTQRFPVSIARPFLASRFARMFYAAPWLGPESFPPTNFSWQEILARHAAIPPGVIARHGTTPLIPARVPDLIGIQERRYLDATGLARHREIGDLMRYAAMNQDGDVLARYRDFVPRESVPAIFGFGKLPEDPAKLASGRFSDEQLYALALYLYNLRSPPNPNSIGAESARGKKVFEREGCGGCHTPPAYTNNMLTLASGFNPPSDHIGKYHVLKLSVGTNPDLALKTRRGTGYYKVPSLRGLWYRGPLEHSGSVTTLEDWFDSTRLREDYVPTGFKGFGVKTRAVKGHEFGLTLSVADKAALIAFLRTL